MVLIVNTGSAREPTMPNYILQIFEENDNSGEVMTLSIEADSAEDALEKLQSGDGEIGEVDDQGADGEDAEVNLPTSSQEGPGDEDREDGDREGTIPHRQPME